MATSDSANSTTPPLDDNAGDATHPQTRGQNPDRAHEGALHAEAATTTPDDATKRGGYGGSAQGDYDNRDGSPRPAGGGQSDPAPTNASSRPGQQHGYTNEPARQGSTAQGTGSRGGSYNDQNANTPHAVDAGQNATDAASTTGAASGLINTGPDQQRAEARTQTRPADGPDSGGASSGRAPATAAETPAETVPPREEV